MIDSVDSVIDSVEYFVHAVESEIHFGVGIVGLGVWVEGGEQVGIGLLEIEYAEREVKGIETEVVGIGLLVIEQLWAEVAVLDQPEIATMVSQLPLVDV